MSFQEFNLNQDHVEQNHCWIQYPIEDNDSSMDFSEDSLKLINVCISIVYFRHFFVFMLYNVF